MEKTWQQKLSGACVDYYAAVDKEKSGTKLAELLNSWGEVSKSALLQAAGMEFKEILSWLNSIAPGLQNSYAGILIGAATNKQDRLLAVMLAGSPNDVITLSAAAEVSMLAEIAENIILNNLSRDKARANFLTAVNNRPDILTLFKSETFKKFALHDDNAHFLKNEKLDLLLNCFKTARDYKNFSEKIKTGERFVWHFNNNETILKRWNELSSAELVVTQNIFNSAMTAPELVSSAWHLVVEVHDFASLAWKNDLNNFKAILRLLNTKHFPIFIHNVAKYQGKESFYYEVAIIARDAFIRNKLKEGISDFQQLYHEARNEYSVESLGISKTRKKIIKAYLKA